MNAPSTPTVGRLAPSPTGHLHVGHALSFLAAWWSARSAGGQVVLRMEDLDRSRSRPQYVDDAREDLEWLGLDWDRTFVQSDDLEPYRRAVASLLDDGLAYACTCSRKEIAATVSAPHASDGEMRYSGTCRGRYASVQSAEEESGSPAGVRFRVPDGEHAIIDELRGRIARAPSQEAGDFLLMRRDGAVAYQLACVVDDARQGVTEVVRGDDLLPSAVRQHLLQSVLQLPHPRQVHLPLVVDASGRRLSKRDGDLTLRALRARGIDASVVTSWAAATLGFGRTGDHRTAPEWTADFTFAHAGRDPIVLDPETFSARLA
ncbi:MAG: tRNA glutamyl-Q(34) synthetase GluQRS [Planctomycetota bacterium]